MIDPSNLNTILTLTVVLLAVVASFRRTIVVNTEIKIPTVTNYADTEVMDEED